jgi:hypothetical protein
MFTGMISFMLVRRRLTSAVAALALGLGLSPLAAADPPGRVARLNYVQGSVSFRPGGVEEWASATVNYPLTIGGDLWVDQGARAELHIGSTAIRLTPQTSFSFLNLDDRTVQIRLSQGSLTVRIQRIVAGEVFEIDTPNGAVTLARPGSYRVDVDSDRVTATVTVRRGEAEIMSAGAILPVRSGEAVFLVGGDAPTYDLREPAPPDEWETWGSGRDAREDQAPALRYVSREVTGYEDLDAHGTWRVDATYGAVWSPTTVVVGWAPYRHGHWAWVDPWGWTWIDDAPWGFAPFHYGRWAFISGGWGWIPGTIVVQPVYAPALVAFVGGANFSLSVSFGGIAGIGWFPLAPREVYVPPYQYSPTYIRNVNITNVNVTNINVTNVNYLNRHVPGAVTAVSHEVFVSARPVATAAVLVSSRAATTAQVVGMTAPLAPRHESVFGREATSGDSRRVVRPPDQVLARPVVARVAPPPAPISFEVRRKALEAQPGRPLDPRALETLRGKEPSKALLIPAVRPAAPGRDAPEAKHALKPAREGLPAPKPVAVEGFVPAPQPGVAREVAPAPVAPEATGKPGKAPQPGVAREVAPAPVAPEATGKPGKAPQPGVAREVAPAPVAPAATDKAGPASRPGVAREAVPAPVAPEVTGKPGKAPQPGVAREAVPAPVAPEATGKPEKPPRPGVSPVVAPAAPSQAPRPGVAREVAPAPVAPEATGKAGQVPRPGVAREVVAPAPAAPPGKKAPKPGEVSGEEAAPESADKAQPEGSGKGKPKP